MVELVSAPGEQTPSGSGLASSGPEPRRIPAVLHFIWMGDQELPPEYGTFIKMWQHYHPEWKVCGWDEKAIRKQLLTHSPGLLKLFNNAEQIVAGSPWQFRSDIARYDLLQRYGGVYVDVDTEPQRSIAGLCGVDCWFAWERQDKWVGNTYIGAAPHHPFIQRLILGLPQQVQRFGDGAHRANVVSGPQYVTHELAAWKGQPVAVWEESLFYPYGYDELHRQGEKFPEAYAIHHWNNQRNKKGVIIKPTTLEVVK